MSTHERDELLESLRPRAFAIAYRMLGSVSEAEDVVQEGLLRLHTTLEKGESIASPEAFLTTIVTRLAIDELRSARVRRETYVGEWLPEPLVTDALTISSGSAPEDPARHAEVADSLSTALLVVLESLSPEQRAAFLLRDVFDYPYERIAAIVGKSEEATRQLATRARRHVEENRPRFETTEEEAERLAESFFAAWESGDLEGLETVLAEDVEVHGDGGGKAPALGHVLRGRVRAARTLSAWAMNLRGLKITLKRERINGLPGVVSYTADGEVLNAITVEVGDGAVQRVNSVINPDKLGHLGPVADAQALLVEMRTKKRKGA
jgi:RNA polymerase sigma factor (sigma-70 family)